MSGKEIDLKRATEKGYENALIDLNQKSWLKLAMSCLPGVGSPVNELLAAKASKFTAQRWDALFGQMREAMEQLDTSKLDRDFFESEEFYDLLLRAMDGAARTRQEVDPENWTVC